jgi:tetratricopeptide (TPR) repeat protein
MTRHYDHADLLAYVDGSADAADAAAVAVHVAACDRCAARLRDLRAFEELLSDAATWLGRDDSIADTPAFDRFARLAEQFAADTIVAEHAFADLQRRPLETWSDYLAAHPETCTEGLARRLIDEAVRDLDRNPGRTLSVLFHAERIVAALPGDMAAEVRSECAKNRSNALRMLGRYEEALAAADAARAAVEECSVGAFAYAQATYTRGIVLFKMGRLADAVSDAREAAYRFAEFGDARRVIHARSLEAVALTEQGAIDEALQVHQMLLPHLERLGDRDAAARVTANIAVAHLRNGDYGRAAAFARDARARYVVLRADAEVIRMDWLLGTLTVKQGDEAGLAQLEAAATAFEHRGMEADGAFVKLDLAEHHLERKHWALAERLAREVADTFARSGARVHVMTALAYLRTAVERREATPTLVRYVRTYLQADDPARQFRPPM